MQQARAVSLKPLIPIAGKEPDQLTARLPQANGAIGAAGQDFTVAGEGDGVQGAAVIREARDLLACVDSHSRAVPSHEPERMRLPSPDAANA